MKESERVVIAKPVASRPSSSSIRLLTDSVALSTQSNCPETLDASIRPKTERFKHPATASVSCPRREGSGYGKSFDDSKSRNHVIYKPKAQLVSQATISALADMVNHQQTWRESEAVANRKRVTQGTHRAACQNLVPRVPSFTESETLKGGGYNWRKYRQKQVKGSDYPRSYYKCTRTICPVKKRVERSYGGHVSEILYQGEHNHSKPSSRAPTLSSLGFQKPSKGLAYEGSIGQNPSNVPLLCTQEKVNEGYVITPFEFAVPRPVSGTWDSSGCRSSQCDEGELDDPSRSKRMKKEKQSSEVAGKPDSHEDGFKWRKYGQKVVGGHAYPRSYYRCTSVSCGAKKHVERASDDPIAFITTYEGQHNHTLQLMRPPTSSTPPLPFSSPQHSNQVIP